MRIKYTVECEYYATGEGIHYFLMYCYAQSEADALTQFNKKFGSYYGMGAEIKQGWITEGKIPDLFLNVSMKDFIDSERCYTNYASEFHFNCS